MNLPLLFLAALRCVCPAGTAENPSAVAPREPSGEPVAFRREAQAFHNSRARAQFCKVADISITNECAIFSFDAKGRISSICERDGGRELLSKPTPFIGVGLPKCGFLGADRMEMRDGLMVFSIPDGRGDVTLRPKPFASGCTFEIAGFNVPEALKLYVGRVQPACRKWQGRRANMMSDETAGVCLRTYEIFAENSCGGPYLQASVPSARAAGARFGLVAAVRGRLQRALQDMTLASGRPHSPGGGAWTLGGRDVHKLLAFFAAE